MPAGDPVGHSLRGLIGNALQNDRPELAEQYRQELRMFNIAKAIEKNLADAPPLTGPQVRQLRMLVESYGPVSVRSSSAAVEDAIAV